MMKKATLLILAAFLLPTISLAKVAGCEYAPETENPATNEKIIATKWQPIKQGTGSGVSFTRGYVRGISEGDEKYAGTKMDVTHYRPIPPELGIKLEDTNIITKKGVFDPRLDPFVDELRNTPFIIPAGSALRLTLEDRTTLVIRTDEDQSFLPLVTKPQWDSNSSSEYRLQYRVISRYLLDADSIALLQANLVVSLRLELPYQYYYFGHRNLIWDDRIITEKTMATIQGALKCVL
jgi:hypothetical protein